MAKDNITEDRRPPLLKWLRFAAVLLMAGVIYCGWNAIQGQDLSDIDGYGEGELVAAKNIHQDLLDSLRDQKVIEITEKDLNAYVQHAIELKQRGTLEEKVKAREVWFRIKEDVLEVIIEREVWGYPHTVAAHVSFPQFGVGDGRTKPAMQWEGVRVGKQWLPQGYAVFFQESFKQLAECFSPEVESAFRQMGRISLLDGSLKFDPVPQRENSF